MQPVVRDAAVFCRLQFSIIKKPSAQQASPPMQRGTTHHFILLLTSCRPQTFQQLIHRQQTLERWISSDPTAISILLNNIDKSLQFMIETMLHPRRRLQYRRKGIVTMQIANRHIRMDEPLQRDPCHLPSSALILQCINGRKCINTRFDMDNKFLHRRSPGIAIGQFHRPHHLAML